MLTFVSTSTMFFSNAGAPDANATSTVGDIPIYSFCYDTVGQDLYFCADNTPGAMVWKLLTFLL